MSFSQGGNPSLLPPNFQDDVVARGGAVSDLAKQLHLQILPAETGNETENASVDNFGSHVSNQTPNMPKDLGHDFGVWVSSQRRQNEIEVADVTVTPTPKIIRIPAVNIQSGYQMPANIPQNAVDHSRALNPVDPSGTPFPLPPGRAK